MYTLLVRGFISKSSIYSLVMKFSSGKFLKFKISSETKILFDEVQMKNELFDINNMFQSRV